LISGNAEREKRMALGIQERKATVEKNIIIGDIEYYKGEEFINRIKD
jgi:hypothetical protein